MFKHLPLLWANLGRKKLRTGLTLASIVVAFLLFGLMQTLRIALTGKAASPPVFQVAALCGKSETLARLKAARAAAERANSERARSAPAKSEPGR